MGRSAPTSLMRMAGPYRGADGNGRHWMAYDPDLPWPSVRDVLWWFAWIAALILLIAFVHGQSGR